MLSISEFLDMLELAMNLEMSWLTKPTATLIGSELFCGVSKRMTIQHLMSDIARCGSGRGFQIYG